MAIELPRLLLKHSQVKLHFKLYWRVIELESLIGKLLTHYFMDGLIVEVGKRSSGDQVPELYLCCLFQV